MDRGTISFIGLNIKPIISRQLFSEIGIKHSFKDYHGIKGVQMSHCPCGSTKLYAECCQLVHNNHGLATMPEQLMRARYCAHVLKLVDFVVNTYHPSCNAESQREGIIESINMDWQKLEVIHAPVPTDDTGFVEFKAYLVEQGVEQCMHERSRFIKEGGFWYYIDGEFPDVATKKVGRNDPCTCGSGKKYKKCCG